MLSFQHRTNVKIVTSKLYILFVFSLQPAAFLALTAHLSGDTLRFRCAAPPEAAGLRAARRGSRLWRLWEWASWEGFAVFLAAVGAHSVCASEWMNEWVKYTERCRLMPDPWWYQCLLSRELRYIVWKENPESGRILRSVLWKDGGVGVEELNCQGLIAGGNRRGKEKSGQSHPGCTFQLRCPDPA